MADGKKTRKKTNAGASPRKTATRSGAKRSQAFQELDRDLRAHLSAANQIVRKMSKRKLFDEQGHDSIEDFVLASLKDHLPVAIDAVPAPPPAVEVLSLPPDAFGPPPLHFLSVIEPAPPTLRHGSLAPMPDDLPSALSLPPERVSKPPMSARPSKGPLAVLDAAPAAALEPVPLAEPTPRSATAPSFRAQNEPKRPQFQMLAAAFAMCVLSGFGGTMAALRTSSPRDAAPAHIQAPPEDTADPHSAAPAHRESAPAPEAPEQESKPEHAPPHATSNAVTGPALAAKPPRSMEADLAEIVEMAKKLPVDKVAAAPVKATVQAPHSGH